MRTKFMSIVFLMSVFGCATQEHSVKELDSEITKTKGSVNGGVVGLNDKNQVLVQEESFATDELLVQQEVNFRLQENYENEAFLLKKCRVDLSDPRLGGNGELPEFKEVDSFKDIVEIKEEMGLVNGEIKIVKKSFFDEQYKAEKKLTTTLHKMISVTKDSKERCERKMEIARRNVGLPGKRYGAQGYFTSGGTWVESRKAEHSLDDAFEIGATQQAKNPKAVDLTDLQGK